VPFADTATGARLHYDVTGAGEPLVLVHGLLGTAQRHFGRVIDWLKPDYHLFGLTLRGYGESMPKPRDFPLRFHHRDADDVLAFMDAVRLERAHVLGYSDGGEVALVAGGKQPERFLSVAVIGAVGYFSPAVRPRIQQLYPGDWITEEEKILHGIDRADQFILQWVNAMKHYVDSGGDVSLGTADRITCPLLIMLGDEDTLNPAEFAHRFLGRTANGRLELFHCGHDVHEKDWANFQRVYGAFLRSTRG
jgi:valacyclovir hydrolase